MLLPPIPQLIALFHYIDAISIADGERVMSDRNVVSINSNLLERIELLLVHYPLPRWPHL